MWRLIKSPRYLCDESGDSDNTLCSATDRARWHLREGCALEHEPYPCALQLTNEVMSKAGIPVVSTWNDTLPLWEFHRDNGHGLECTHFCHPSAPQLWVYRLYETLAQLRREKQIETF